MRYIKSKIASTETPQILTCDVLPNEQYTGVYIYIYIYSYIYKIWHIYVNIYLYIVIYNKKLLLSSFQIKNDVSYLLDT